MLYDDATLLDIAQAVSLILDFVDEVDEDDFCNDSKTQSAVLHQLLIMGEAVKRLSTSFRDEHPEINWKSIAGLRDILIHAYDTVDIELVWEIVNEHIPKLQQQIKPLLPQP